MQSLRFLTIAIAILSISVCSEGQIRKTVYGNNKVVTKERHAEHFTGVRVSTGINVYLKQGNNEAISVEADENLHEYILTEVRDGVLHVYTEVNIREAERKRVYVTMKEVNSVRTSSAGDVTGETPIKSDRLELSASSAGDINYMGNPKYVDAHSSSAGGVHKR